MQNALKTIMVCGLSAGLTVACSSSSNTNGSNNASNNNSPSDSLSAKYQGTYLKACTPDGAGGAGTEELTITDLTAVKIDTDYSDIQCANSPVITSTSVSITYPGGTTTTELGEADHVDAVMIERIEDGIIQVTPASDSLIFTIFAMPDNINLYLGDPTVQFDGKTAANRETSFKEAPLIRQ